MVELLTLPFFQRALLVGVVLGILMAVLGVFVVLRRMSFFADAIGHSALTGIALGILLTINPFLAAFVFALIVATSISYVKKYSRLHLDTVLGVFFPGAVALGVIIVQLTPGYQTDLISFLFGNILTVSPMDVTLSIALTIVSLVAVIWAGKKFLLITLDESLAQAEGVRVQFHETLLLLLLAAVIALAIKLVGVILVTAMLITPAATAQNLASSMTRMFVVSIIAGVLAVVIGMFTSAVLSIPSGPTIVLSAVALFSLSLVLRSLRIQV